MQRRAAQQLAAAFGKKLSANARQPCGSTQALTWQECGFSTKAYWDTPGFCNQISNPKVLHPHACIAMFALCHGFGTPSCTKGNL